MDEGMYLLCRSACGISYRKIQNLESFQSLDSNRNLLRSLQLFTIVNRKTNAVFIFFNSNTDRSQQLTVYIHLLTMKTLRQAIYLKLTKYINELFIVFINQCNTYQRVYLINEFFNTQFIKVLISQLY